MYSIPSERLPPSGSYQGLAGISGGIPTNYTQFCDVTQAPYNADNTGATDATTAINDALSDCPNQQYVYAPTGTYRCDGTIGRQGTYNFDGVQHHFSIMLKGDGPGLTRIISNAAGNSISFSNGLGPIGGGAILSGGARGSTEITVDTSQPNAFWSTGQWALVKRINSEAITDRTLQPAEQPGGYEEDTCSQWVRITGISGGSNPRTVSFTPALNEAYASDTINMPASVPYRCGLEDFYIERNITSAGQNILFTQCQECWVKGVESNRAMKWHIRLNACAGCEIRECYVHDTPGSSQAAGGGDSDYGVGLYQFSCSNLVENNIAGRCRHGFVTEYGGQCNVIAYNYEFNPINEHKLNTDYMMEAMGHHGGEPRFNLWEGNVIGKAASDYLLGGSRFITLLRNRIRRRGLPVTTVSLFGTDIQRWNWYYTLVGNVYEYPRVATALRRWGSSGDDVSDPDPNSEATAILHGEYDFVSNAITYSDPDHSIPNSLFRTEKPSWWGNLPWPSCGPDIAPKSSSSLARGKALYFGFNPAYYRARTLGLI